MNNIAFFNEYFEPLIYFFIMAAIVRGYFNILKFNFPTDQLIHNDPLNIVLFTIPGLPKEWVKWSKFSSWPVTHVLFHMFMGYRFPDMLLFCFIMGVLWEVYEKLQGIMMRNTYKFTKVRVMENGSSNLEYLNWWDSSTRDVYLNGLGLFLGHALSKMVNGV